jgi:hypothetical protein
MLDLCSNLLTLLKKFTEVRHNNPFVLEKKSIIGPLTFYRSINFKTRVLASKGK